MTQKPFKGVSAEHAKADAETRDEMSELEILMRMWPIFLGLIGFIVGLVRLEAGMRNNARSIRDLAEQRKEDLRAASKARDETHEMLKEMRTDIKHLVREVTVVVSQGRDR